MSCEGSGPEAGTLPPHGYGSVYDWPISSLSRSIFAQNVGVLQAELKLGHISGYTFSWKVVSAHSQFADSREAAYVWDQAQVLENLHTQVSILEDETPRGPVITL